MIYHMTQPLFADIQAFQERIEQMVYEKLADLSITAYTSKEPLPFARRTDGEKRDLQTGERWGGLFDCAWFHFTGTVPQSPQGTEIVLLIDLSGEALVVDSEGNPRQCLTTMACWYDFTLGKPGKRTVYPDPPLTSGNEVDLWVDAGNNDLFGREQNNGSVVEAAVAVLHRDRFSLYHDYALLLETLQHLPEKSARYQRILHALWKAKNAVTSWARGEVAAARDALAPELARRNGNAPFRLSAVGHSHLDLAWLWPIRESYRKGARTFSNILMLMERYPDFRFVATQAQLYAWMKEHYPSLYARVQTSVAAGRWEMAGATWVEPDLNVTCGESLVRQFLLGKRFARAEFGRDVRFLLLPDSFGYTGALPQLMRKAGIDAFLTTKMTWDRYNTYPHQSFFWEGIDGSRVLAHFPPEGTYNSSAAPRALRKAEQDYLDKGVSEHALLLFGIGDGGGGPDVDHLERLKREKDLAGFPPVTQEHVQAFLDRLDTEKEEFATWSGELFLACHQGTYTTQGRNKRHNRLMEVGMHDLEFLCVAAALLGHHPYPSGALSTLWQEMLLYQFHDILPGSSITRVYAETDIRYAAMEQTMDTLRQAAWKSVAGALPTGGARSPVLVVNTIPWKRTGWVAHAGKWLEVETPAMGIAVIDAAKARSPEKPRATSTSLENEHLLAEFAADGTILRLFDKEHQREVATAEGGLNRLVVYDDRGDAWDFTPDTFDRPVGEFRLAGSACSVNGPHAQVEQTYLFGGSTLVLTVRLTAGSRRLEFATTVEWHETGKMLRALFPLAINAPEAVCEIQFGHVRRPTTRSTMWEESLYEINAQKWIDLSRRDYGVAMLKECKYGHRVEGNLLDVDLLRSPVFPDPVADQGHHAFTYALYPHAGDHIAGEVIREAYDFSFPLLASGVSGRGKGRAEAFSLVETDTGQVIVEHVKKAEDSGRVVLRLYEAHGTPALARVTFAEVPRGVWRTNLLEEEETAVAIDGKSVQLAFHPFEVTTLAVDLGLAQEATPQGTTTD